MIINVNLVVMLIDAIHVVKNVMVNVVKIVVIVKIAVNVMMKKNLFVDGRKAYCIFTLVML